VAATFIALLIGLVTTVVIAFPIAFLIRFGSVNLEQAAIIAIGAMFWSLSLLGETVLATLKFWAIPAFILNLLALRLRLNLVGFIAAGAIAGLLGLSLVGADRYLATIAGEGSRAPREWDNFLTLIPYSTTLIALVGAIGAISAWAFMRTAAHMRPTTSANLTGPPD